MVVMIWAGILIWSVVGFLVIPVFKAGVMKGMGWASFKVSLKHAFWINILLIPIVIWDAKSYFRPRLPFFDSLSNERQISAYIVSFFVSSVLVIGIEGIILSVLLFARNKNEPFKRAWIIAAVTNIPYILFLFFKLGNIIELL